MHSHVLLLDGAMGSALEAYGVCVAGPSWSARAVLEAPEAVADLHRRYAEAGAVIHTANTFRAEGNVAERAVKLAREVVGKQRIAGSIAPSADCYHPGETRPTARAHHRARARALARAGVDLFLCETFADGDEALIAIEETVDFDRPTWLALTGGPKGDLASPDDVARTAHRAVAAGASAILVNCTAASLTLDYVRALRGLDVPLGAYANAGGPDEGLGHFADWQAPCPPPSEMEARAERYAAIAATWIAEGAMLIGGCCGTFPEHIAALARLCAADG